MGGRRPTTREKIYIIFIKISVLLFYVIYSYTGLKSLLASDICQFPSEVFYNNRLKTHTTVDEEMGHFPLQPLCLYDMTNSKHYVDRTRSSYNIDEVDFVIQFCTMLATDISVWQSLIATDSGKPEKKEVKKILLLFRVCALIIILDF